QRVVEVHGALAAQKGVRLEWTVRGEPRPIQGDPVKLERALANLLGNAIKFTPKGGRVLVEVAAETGTGVDAGLRWTTFKVVDSGPGIAPEELPYIFDAYRHARRHSAGEGVGLGLAIVQNIVASHRGRLLAQSQLNLGSSFTIMLPC
ncbi:MAG: HAMP domain-containing histidine kinase, partial [Acidobacteriota bacterium]|nr:HAMP domain-containing histidine kinase [Acidobacteriota bacterium]